MTSDYSISVDYSPVYELVISFYVFTNYHNLKNVHLDETWYNKTKQKLPADYARELEDERWEVLHRVVLLISQCPKKETVEDFLAWFGQLPAGELYERLAPWVTSIPLNLGEIRDRSTYLLSMWNKHYFQQLDPKILTFLQEEANRQLDRSGQFLPADLIEELTDGLRIEPAEQLSQVILIPQYHAYPSTVLDFFRGIATCLYPAKQMIESEESVTQSFLQTAQCLSDEKRLRILIFIAKKPRTLTEIQQHVKLAKSTVHHHITALRRAGIIRSHHVGHTTPAFYSLREGFFGRMQGQLQELLQKEEESNE